MTSTPEFPKLSLAELLVTLDSVNLDGETACERLAELEELAWEFLSGYIRDRGYDWCSSVNPLFDYYVRNSAMPWVIAGSPKPLGFRPPKGLSPAALRKRQSRAQQKFEYAYKRYGLVPCVVFTHKHILNLLQKRGELPRNPTQGQVNVAVSKFLEDCSDMLADDLLD